MGKLKKKLENSSDFFSSSPIAMGNNKIVTPAYSGQKRKITVNSRSSKKPKAKCNLPPPATR
jgi:hypothetical protein